MTGAPRPGRWVLVLGVLLAVIGAWKPVHMDDAAFLRVAQQIRADPSDPYGFAWEYLGEPTPATQGLPHPPLWPGLLALAIAGGGFEEWALTLPAILVALALVVGIGRLLPDREDARARWTLLLSPVALVLLQTSMSDVAALAFGLLGLGTLRRAQLRGSAAGALEAGLWLAAAAWTRYPALVFAAAAAFAVHSPLPRARWRAWFAAGLPVLAVGLLQAWTAARLGEAHLLSVWKGVRFEDRRAPELRWAAFLPALCVAAPAALAGALARGRRRASTLVLLAGGALGLAAAVRSSTVHGIVYDPAHRALLAALCGGGALLLWRSARAADGGLARAWLVLAAIAVLGGTPVGAARYVLPWSAACVFALRRELAAAGRRAWAGVLALQLLLAIGLVGADLEAARAARDAAQQVARDLADERGAVWLRGELGFRFELERRGVRYLDGSDPSARPGDLLLRSERATPAGSRFAPAIEASLPARPERSWRAEGAWPLRLHQPYAGAGFYGHPAGLLPFAFSSVPHDVLHAHRLVEVPELLDLGRAERLGIAGDPELAAEFERYARVRPMAPRAGLELEPSLCLVARRALRGEMALRYRVDLPAEPRVLRGRWAEPWRLVEEGIAGTGSAGEIRVSAREGEGPVLVVERTFRARVEPSARRWFPLELDLEPLRGRPVWVELRCRVPDEEAAEDAVAYVILCALDLEPR